jgi:peptidyl-prolyl cis-trans isomerase-like protein 2
VVGGLDVLRKMELVDCDKKERPKVSIKIEDCLVFVDPYQEVDNQLLEERMRPEKEKAEAELRKQKEEQNKPMKPLREGVGKYIR